MADVFERNPVRAVVTGASGMIGSALVKELQGDDTFVVLGLSRGDVDLMDADATAVAFARAAPDIVFHVAARVAGIGGNLATPGQMFYENVRINGNVVDAARRAGARKVVAVGSAAIYSDLAPLPMSEADIWLGPPHSSEAAYGHAKRAMLAQLEAYKEEYGLDYAYCVLTNTFGPGDKFDEAHGHVLPSLISKFHRAVNDGDELNIWGTGTPRRDFIYSKDVARALHLIGAVGSGAINIASGVEVTIRELVEKIAAVSGYAGEVLWDPAKPNGQELRSYDISRLRALGFAPAYSLDEALAETFTWYATNAGKARR